MILVTEGADIKLQKALYHVREKKNGTRCIKIKMESTEGDALLRVVKAIDDVIDDPDGSIFECSDNELFILANGLTARTAEKLNTALYHTLMPTTASTPVQQNAEPAILLDPMAQWTELMDYIDAKVLKAEQRVQEHRQETERRKKERVREWVMNMEFEPEILKTLDRRRQTRDRLGICIVEDDAFTRNLVVNTLKAIYDIHSAGDGYTAVSKYPAHASDIVFLDIDLPDVNGLDILRKILAVDKNAYVIMLSGNSQKENVLKAIELGAKGFVGKPFTKEKLLGYIQKCPRFSSLQTGAST